MTSPLRVDQPVDEVLTASPLKLVVCQVRHETKDAASAPATALTVQERLKPWALAIRTLNLSNMSIAVGPQGATVGQTPHQQGWQLHTSDDRWTVSITPEWFSIETVAYTRWSNFSERCEEVIDAVADAIAPVLEQRIGLRYVDELRFPSVLRPTDWAGKIARPLLGLITDERLGEAVRSTQQLVQLDAAEPLGVILRHGSLVEEQGLVYLLDHDCFHLASRPFDPPAVKATLEELHALARNVFEATLEPGFYALLRDGTAQ